MGHAAVMAAQMTGEAGRETLLLIARQHLEKPEKAERSRVQLVKAGLRRRAKSYPVGMASKPQRGTRWYERGSSGAAADAMMQAFKRQITKEKP
jgi:hypothetical protein